MGRCSFAFLACLALALLLGGITGCGSTGAASPVQPPALVTITPATNASLDLGATLQFTAAARNSSNTSVAVPITFTSSNTAVLTISNGGLACGGTWDSLVAPVVCAPGPSGVAMVAAQSEGVASPPVTVYVHEHIDSFTITPVNPPNSQCFSQNTVLNYHAVALSRGIDITNSVGPLTWQQANANVVKLTTNLPTIPFNEAQATANLPGFTRITANAAGAASSPVDFTTCPVRSISLLVNGTDQTSFIVPKGTAKTITATVTDTLGNTLTGVKLSFSSTQPAVVTTTSSGSATGALVGGGDVTVSCTPPNCNEGLVPPQPVYADQALALTVTPASNSTAQTTTAFVTSTGCGTNLGCTTEVFPISTSTNVLGIGAPLPNPPNSFVFSPDGKKAFLGSEQGLMTLNPSAAPISVSARTDVTGKVLAVSPDGNTVIVSDTGITPNQVFVVNASNTTTPPVDLLITGATSARFSPDGLKAFILAGSTLYVYSSLEALKTIPLAGPANDVTFLPMGAFVYFAGGDVGNNGPGAAVSVRNTCDNQPATGTNTTLSTQGVPSAIRALVNGTDLLALDSPGIDLIHVYSITAPSSPTQCAQSVTNSYQGFVNLGQGQFTPIDFLVSTDSTKAYILASGFGSVLSYTIGGGSSSAIPLVGNATALSGDLTDDGTTLYVGASDGRVHVVSTVLGGDTTQIPIPAGIPLCGNVSFTCMPDLVRVQP